MNVVKLKKAIDESGITITALAGKAEISRGALYAKLESGEFRVTEARRISDALRLTDAEKIDIFFN